MHTTIIEHALTTLGVEHEFIDTLNGCAFRLSARSFDCRGLLFADDDHEQVGLLLVAPVRIPRESRVAVSQYIIRANSSFRIGNLDLDLDDGEWRFRYGIDVECGALTGTMVQSMVGVAVNALEAHHDSIMHVASGDADPEQALAAAREARLSALGELLPPRPETTDTSPDEASMTPPVDPMRNSYRVTAANLIGGEYPGSPPNASDLDMVAKLDAYLDAGITAFIDLTELGELEPYHDTLAALARGHQLDVIIERFPIPDVGICDTATMRTILDRIDALRAEERTVYVHCYGGIGRTGMVIGCWLVRHGTGPEHALAQVDNGFRSMSAEKLARNPGKTAPETSEQKRVVREWAAGA